MIDNKTQIHLGAYRRQLKLLAPSSPTALRNNSHGSNHPKRNKREQRKGSQTDVSLRQLDVAQLMQNLPSISNQSTWMQAVILGQYHQITKLCVHDEDKLYCGILDLNTQPASDSPIQQHIVLPQALIDASDSINNALKLIIAQDMDYLPVQNSNKLGIGMVTKSAILNTRHLNPIIEEWG